jgi:hypothetical protein
MAVCSEKGCTYQSMSAFRLFPLLFRNLRQVQNGVVRYHGLAVYLKNLYVDIDMFSAVMCLWKKRVYINPFAHRVSSSSHITLLLNFEKKIARGDMGVH